MNFDEFESQVNRLQAAFGKAAFPTERTALIWREVQRFEFGWLERLTDQLISGERQAPLPQKFAEAASLERERLYQIEKAKHREEAEEFMSSFSGADIQTICGAIRARATGRMGANAYQDFVNGLNDLSKKVIFRCSRCEDTGHRTWTDERGRIWAQKCNHK